MLVKDATPVKSEILSSCTLRTPLNAAASETCISPSPFVFIDELPTSAALKFASGILTFWALVQAHANPKNKITVILFMPLFLSKLLQRMPINISFRPDGLIQAQE
jgi:hypothetical protein